MGIGSFHFTVHCGNQCVIFPTFLFCVIFFRAQIQFTFRVFAQIPGVKCITMTEVNHGDVPLPWFLRLLNEWMEENSGNYYRAFGMSQDDWTLEYETLRQNPFAEFKIRVSIDGCPEGDTIALTHIEEFVVNVRLSPTMVHKQFVFGVFKILANSWAAGEGRNGGLRLTHTVIGVHGIKSTGREEQHFPYSTEVYQVFFEIFHLIPRVKMEAIFTHNKTGEKVVEQAEIAGDPISVLPFLFQELKAMGITCHGFM